MASSPVTPHTPADALALKRRTITLALLTFVYFFSYMDRYILAILLELIKADLHLSDTQLGLLSGLAFAVFYATLGIPVAWLADRKSRRTIIAIALALWSGMTALCGLAQNYTQLLAARIGVGIGEAGSSPPSHSIIADLYAPHERASAMAIYTTGVVLGGGFGSMIGGSIAAAYGWRAAMMAIGIPGVILALLIKFVLVEPRRGLSDPSHVPGDSASPKIRDGFRSLFGDGVAVHLVMAVTITSLIGYALTAFGFSMLQRSYGIPMRSLALFLAPGLAIVGTVSGIGGGWIADKAAKRWGLHAQSLMVAILKTCALPCTLVFCIAPNGTVAISALVLSYVFASSYLGPTFALLQGLAPVKLRAMWAAITLLVINLIGLGLGPTLVGGISDALKPTYGADSLRYAMFLIAAITPWAIFHYWRAGAVLGRRERGVTAAA